MRVAVQVDQLFFQAPGGTSPNEENQTPGPKTWSHGRSSPVQLRSHRLYSRPSLGRVPNSLRAAAARMRRS